MNGNYIFHTFRLPIINNMILIMEAVGFCAGVLDKDLPQLNLCRHKSLLEYRLMIFLSADKISFRCSILVINRAVDLSQSLILFHTRCALGRNLSQIFFLTKKFRDPVSWHSPRSYEQTHATLRLSMSDVSEAVHSLLGPFTSFMCAWQESNLRPSGPQPDALSTELQAQK